MVEQELKAALGKNIKFLRFRRELSQADLAEETPIVDRLLEDFIKHVIWKTSGSSIKHKNTALRRLGVYFLVNS
jgi:transcriptional regulator with XRE-family HTH domain